MERFDLENLSIGEKIQFINAKEFFEGAIIKLYDKYFGISIYTEQDRFKPVTVNEKVEFIIAHEDKAFRCISKVIGCKLEDRFEIAILDVPEIINKIERRQYPRVNLIKEAEYCFLPSKKEYRTIKDIPLACYGQMKKTFTVDISSGGMKIITYEDSKDSDYVLASIYIDKEIKILCSVVRKEFDESNKNYSTALKFMGLDKAQWQRIDTFVRERLKEN